VIAHGCTSWKSDGWAGDAVELVGAEHGIATEYVSTSTALRDICKPFESALSLARGDAVALSGCDGIGDAIAQLRGVQAGPRDSVIWPEAGDDHGEFAQALLRAMAHAGIAALAGTTATTPPRLVLGGDRYSATRQGFSGR
jgi:hypothetical protein